MFLAGDDRMSTMTKMTIIAALLAVLATEAPAQSRTFYDSSGRVVGRSSTDSSGTVTNYDARGKVISRETTSGNTTTVYDDRGRNVGKVTTSPQR
jgi:YD repeat-containing protein